MIYKFEQAAAQHKEVRVVFDAFAATTLFRQL